ncbi:MAG: methylmalonyl Co-A mutase-associated GTPase MeaB [Planctomycetota bacterium]
MAGKKKKQARKPTKPLKCDKPVKSVKKPETPGEPEKSVKKRCSALNVMPGVDGGHDGMPGKSGKAGKVAVGKSTRQKVSLDEYVKGVRAGDRTLLGRAITLIESHAPAHQELAQSLLKALSPHAGRAVRVGITGVPGSGKSTFIEVLGSRLTEKGHKVAVTAVDPSSTVSRGSILGDKTRMERLSRNPNAFIRPTPTGGTLGGVARKTRETLLLFEAAGYDVLFVETVGVGQNEVAVRSMVDFFLLLLVAGAGDELQGLKKGVMELADAVVVNKADGANLIAAEAARAEYERALHCLQPATQGWTTRAFAISAQKGNGVDAMWSLIEEFRAVTEKNNAFSRRRSEQARQWLRQMIDEQLRDAFYSDPAIAEQLAGIERKVMDGTLPVARAAMDLLKAYEEKRDRFTVK